MTNTTTYTKLKTGAWGVRTTAPVKQGDRVQVSKRDGSTKIETIDRVLWTDGVGVWLCAIGGAATTSRPYGSGHGSAPAVRGYSSYCTDNEDCGCFDCAS
jgi:hypothetical protein